MKPNREITIWYPDSPQVADYETTWGEFARDNESDVVADVAAQLESFDYAEIGGGAAPRVCISI